MDGVYWKFVVIFVEGFVVNQYFIIDQNNVIYQQIYN